jgi:hypothetical protein
MRFPVLKPHLPARQLILLIDGDCSCRVQMPHESLKVARLRRISKEMVVIRKYRPSLQGQTVFLTQLEQGVRKERQAFRSVE